MKDFKKLSKRQQNILKFMQHYMDESGYPPTIAWSVGHLALDGHCRPLCHRVWPQQSEKTAAGRR